MEMAILRRTQEPSGAPIGSRVIGLAKDVPMAPARNSMGRKPTEAPRTNPPYTGEPRGGGSEARRPV